MSVNFEKLAPRETVRAYCTQCLGLRQFSADEVKNCTGDAVKCPFFSYRLGKRVSVKIMRKFCLDCTNGDREYVAKCPATTCPVYPYRFGTNPALIGKRTLPDVLKHFNESRRDVSNSGMDSTNDTQDDIRAMSP